MSAPTKSATRRLSQSIGKPIARIKDLPLVAKCIAQGFLQGLQESQQRGVGIEFNQYRAYEVGDELSRIDWKLYARSDRYFVREAERESEIDIWFMLDTSRSMLQESVTENKSIKYSSASSKLEYAKIMIASIAYLANKQGDEFGFVGLSSDGLHFTQKANGNKHWQQLLIELTNLQVGQYFPPATFLERHLATQQRPSIIFIISDFYQKNNEIIDFLSKIDRRQSEVVAINLTSQTEKTFNFDDTNKMIKFKDLETNEVQIVSAKPAKSNYLLNYQQYQEKIIKQLKELDILCTNFDIEKPIEASLYEYMKIRNRISKPFRNQSHFG